MSLTEAKTEEKPKTVEAPQHAVDYLRSEVARVETFRKKVLGVYAEFGFDTTLVANMLDVDCRVAFLAEVVRYHAESKRDRKEVHAALAELGNPFGVVEVPWR